MKKIISLTLCLILCLSLFACNTEEDKPTVNTSDTQTTVNTSDTQTTVNTSDTQITVNTSDTQTTENTSDTQTTVNTESSNTEKDTAQSELDIYSPKSFIEVPVVIENGKIIFDEEEVMGVSFIHSHQGKTNRTTFEHSFSDILNAIKEIDLVEQSKAAGGFFSDFEIYFNNGTKMYFRFERNFGIFLIKDKIYKVEQSVQISNLLSEFTWPHSSSRHLPRRDVSIEENHILFSGTVEGIFISKTNRDGLSGIAHQDVEYVTYNEECDILNSIVAEFEKIDLISLDIPPKVPSSTSATDFHFYCDLYTGDDYLVSVRHVEIDGVHYFDINDIYYSVETSQIEELYSKLTFSLQ